MSRSSRRFIAVAVLGAAVLAPSANAYPDSYRQEYSVSSGRCGSRTARRRLRKAALGS